MCKPEPRELLRHRRPDAGQRRRPTRSSASARGNRRGRGHAVRLAATRQNPTAVTPCHRTRRSRRCRGPACVPTTAPSVVTISISGLRPLARAPSSPAARRARARPRARSRPSASARRAWSDVNCGHELLHRLRVPAHALERDDLALDRQDRLHVQQLSGPRARTSDAPAAAQELERVDREDQPRLLTEALRRAPRSPRPSCRARAGAGSRARASRSPPTRSRSRPCAPCRPSSAAAVVALWYVPDRADGDVQGVDALVGRELLVGREEVARRRLRRRRQLSAVRRRA